MVETKLLLVSLVLLAVSGVLAQDKPNIPNVDRIRLAEAFRLGEAVGNRVWKDWDKAPFAVLLVIPENDFLIRHPRPFSHFSCG